MAGADRYDGLSQVGDLDPGGAGRQGLAGSTQPENSGAPLRFDMAKAISRGRASVLVGKKWGFIDRTALVIEPQYDAAWSFTEGMAWS